MLCFRQMDQTYEQPIINTCLQGWTFGPKITFCLFVSCSTNRRAAKQMGLLRKTRKYSEILTKESPCPSLGHTETNTHCQSVVRVNKKLNPACTRTVAGNHSTWGKPTQQPGVHVNRKTRSNTTIKRRPLTTLLSIASIPKTFRISI